MRQDWRKYGPMRTRAPRATHTCSAIELVHAGDSMLSVQIALLVYDAADGGR